MLAARERARPLGMALSSVTDARPLPGHHTRLDQKSTHCGTAWRRPPRPGSCSPSAGRTLENFLNGRIASLFKSAGRSAGLRRCRSGLKVAFQSRVDLGERQEARPRLAGYKTAAKLLEPEGFTAFRLRR